MKQQMWNSDQIDISFGIWVVLFTEVKINSI